MRDHQTGRRQLDQRRVRPDPRWPVREPSASTNRTATAMASEESLDSAFTTDAAGVIDFPAKEDGGGLDRTADLGIMSGIERDPDEPA